MSRLERKFEKEEGIYTTSSGNYSTGIIGALIGALIGAVPWVLVYVYGGWILSILAIVIGMASYFGYKLLKGVKGRGAVIIVITTSLLSVALATFVVIPLLLLRKDGYIVSLDNLEALYSNSDFTAAIIKDGAVSLIFASLGLTGVVPKIKADFPKGEEIKNEE